MQDSHSFIQESLKLWRSNDAGFAPSTYLPSNPPPLPPSNDFIPADISQPPPVYTDDHLRNCLSSGVFGGTECNNIPGLDIDKTFSDLTEISPIVTDIAGFLQTTSQKSIPGLDLVDISPSKTCEENAEQSSVHCLPSDDDEYAVLYANNIETAPIPESVKKPATINDHSVKKRTSLDEAAVLRAQLLKSVLQKRQQTKETDSVVIDKDVDEPVAKKFQHDSLDIPTEIERKVEVHDNKSTEAIKKKSAILSETQEKIVPSKKIKIKEPLLAKVV